MENRSGVFVKLTMAVKLVRLRRITICHTKEIACRVFIQRSLYPEITQKTLQKVFGDTDEDTAQRGLVFLTARLRTATGTRTTARSTSTGTMRTTVTRTTGLAQKFLAKRVTATLFAFDKLSSQRASSRFPLIVQIGASMFFLR